MSQFSENSQNIDIQTLIKQQLLSLTQSTHTQSTSDEQEGQFTFRYNVYFDKQLSHLVLTQQFDFCKISDILSKIFRYDNIDTSEEACRQRWAQLHKNRDRMKQVRQRNMEQKRIRAVAGFSNPYSLYSVDELIEHLQQNQNKKVEKQVNHEQMVPKEYDFEKKNSHVSGYSIFTDSFRKIDDLQKYNQLQQKMHIALKNAEKNIQCEKPLLYEPQYEQLETFKVKSEELTLDKAKKLMAFQIEMEKINRELTIKEQRNQEQKYQSVIKKKIQKQMREQKGDFDEDWDQYESD